MPPAAIDLSGFSPTSNSPGTAEQSAPMQFAQLLSVNPKGSPGPSPAEAPAGAEDATSTASAPAGAALPHGFIRSMPAAPSSPVANEPLLEASVSGQAFPPQSPISSESTDPAAGDNALEPGEAATPPARAAYGLQLMIATASVLGTAGSEALPTPQTDGASTPISSSLPSKALKFAGALLANKKAASKTVPKTVDQVRQTPTMFPQPVLPPPALGAVSPADPAPNPQPSSVDLNAAAGSSIAGFSGAGLPIAVPPSAYQPAAPEDIESSGEESAGKDLPVALENLALQNTQSAGKPHESLVSSPMPSSFPDAGTAIAKPVPAMSAPTPQSFSAPAPTASPGAATSFPMGIAGASLPQASGGALDSRWMASAAASQSQASAAAGAPGFSLTKRGGGSGNTKTASPQNLSPQTSATHELEPNAVPATTTVSVAQGFESSLNGGNGGSAGSSAKPANPSMEAAFPIPIAPPVEQIPAKSSPSETAAPAALPPSVLAGLNSGMDRIQQHGDSRVDLRIPLEGGSHVDIQLRLQDGAVHASLITGTPELREALRQQWSQLASSGDSLGFRLAEPAFEGAPQMGSGLAQHQSHGHQQGAAPEDPAPNLPSPRSSPKSAPPQTNPIQPTPNALTTWA